MDNMINNQLRTILLVDGEDGTRIMTKWFLNNFFAVETARNAEEALARFDPQVHDLVITENGMSGLSGTEMAHIIKLRSPHTPMVMFSCTAPSDRSCLDFVLLRPTHLMVLKDGVDQLLATPTLPMPVSEHAL